MRQRRADHQQGEHGDERILDVFNDGISRFVEEILTLGIFCHVVILSHIVSKNNPHNYTNLLAWDFRVKSELRSAGGMDKLLRPEFTRALVRADEIAQCLAKK